MSTASIVPSPQNRPALPNAACAASMLIWAAGFPLADRLLDILPPMTVATLRLGFGAAFLLPAWILTEGWRGARAAHWPRGLGVGAVGMGVGAILFIYAQSRTDGVTTAVISATMPVVGIALECLFDGRRLSARLIAGIALSFAGGVGVYGAQMGHLNMGLGAVAALLAVILFAWSSRASVTALPGVSALGRTAVTAMGGALVVLVLQAALPHFGGQDIPWDRIGPQEWLYAAFCGAGSMAISQTLFLIGVASLGIGIATMHMNIAPFYVMALSAALGADWNWSAVGAACLVVLGVIIAQGKRPA